MRIEIAAMFLLAVAGALTGGCDIRAVPPRQAVALPHAAQRPHLPDGQSRVDSERNRIWVLTWDGVLVHDLSRPERVAISLPDWFWVGVSYGCPPDLALGPKGEAVVTSNVLPTVWRIDPDSFAVSVHPLELDADRDKDVGFSGLVYSQQHGAFLAASQMHGSLWKIDLLLTKAQKIPLATPLSDACGLAARPRTVHQAG